MVAITFQAIWSTMHGRGPFLTQTPAENALALQVFLLVMAIPLMLLAVVVEDERRSKNALRQSEAQLLKGRAALNDQLRFERLSTDISSMLMDAPAEELGKQIVPALGQIAQMLGFDAVSLWLLTGKDAALRAYGWREPDTPGLPANITGKDFPWMTRELFAAREVLIGTLDDFPPEAQTDRATSERYGLKSLLAVPMFVSSHPLGALSMGSFREELSVSPQLVQRQRVLANVFGNALVRARAEIALRESEKRLTLAATAGDLGLWLWDLQTNALWATERAKKMFGFAPESELTYEMFYGRVHPEDRPAVDAGIAGAISGKANYETQYRICLPDGAEKWIASRGEVAFEDGGQPVSVTGVVSDVTERHVNAMELSRNRQELAHVARVSTMGELAASLAHELNQPLGAILANAEAAELFLQQNPPALGDLRAILADIRKDDERAGEVIRRMRALLRKHELERQPIEINSLVEDVLQLVSGDASLRGVSLSADLRSVLPQISGDRVHLQQVLLNLILNGMDAMAGEPRERRRITVRTRFGGEGVVELAVVDSGHGIEADKLPRLFEPFYTTKPHGMGMGLSIAHTIIAAHRGRIWAENNPSGGAVFHIALPAAGKEQGSWFGVQDSGGKR
jgi:PAS domain S-box-containing protein